jgi:hypothetical protein
VGFATTRCSVHKLASSRILPPAVEVSFAFFHFVSQVAACRRAEEHVVARLQELGCSPWREIFASSRKGPIGRSWRH